MTAPELRQKLQTIATMAEKHQRESATARRPGEAIAFSYIAELAETLADAITEGVTR